MWVTAEVEIDEQELLDDLTDRELLDELKRRRIGVGFEFIESPEYVHGLIEEIYSLRRTAQNYDRELDQLIWQVLGRIQ